MKWGLRQIEYNELLRLLIGYEWRGLLTNIKQYKKAKMLVIYSIYSILELLTVLVCKPIISKLICAFYDKPFTFMSNIIYSESD